jgi:hypothetical protein
MLASTFDAGTDAIENSIPKRQLESETELSNRKVSVDPVVPPNEALEEFPCV